MAVERAVTALNDVEVTATTDVAAVVVPGAWLKPLTLDRSTLAGGGAVRAHLWLVVEDHGTASAAPALLALLDQALDVLDDLVDDTEPLDLDRALALTDGTYPGIRLTLDLPF